MKLTILNIDYHRNGICGAPFHAIVFRDTGPEGSAKLGIVFEEPRHCAVLDIAKLAECDIEFGSNSWRGDRYELALRRAIADGEKTIESRTSGTGADTGKPIVVVTVRGGLVGEVNATLPVMVFVEDWDCPPDQPLIMDFESDSLTSEQEIRVRERMAENEKHFEPKLG